jgi:hypothetical protein
MRGMSTYLVSWYIDVEADSTREAALEAREIQRSHDSWATLFSVEDARGITVVEDLDDGGE